MSALTTDTHTTTPLPPFITDTPQRSPRPRKERPAPTVRPGEIDCQPVAFVALSGRIGAGKAITIDAERWDEIAATLGVHWTLASNGRRGLYYVRSSRGDAQHIAARRSLGQNFAGRKVTLAREIAGAKRGDRVAYHNEDRLDLRACNLSIVPRKPRRDPAARAPAQAQ